MIGVMRARRLLLLMFFVYVAVDLGCASVPGAFTFEAADSVEAVGAHRMRAPAMPRLVALPAMTIATLAPPLPQPAPSRDPRTMPSAARWQPHGASAPTAAADPRPAVDDD